jgi:hypothetical protein
MDRIRITLLLALAGAIVTSSCRKGDAVVDADPLDPAKYAAYFTHYPFGGRDLDWWQAQLADLSPSGAHPDAKAYALTVERAQRNGLVVEESGGRITVKPDRATTEVLMRRLEVK